jgi:hypothetical protein
VYKIPGRYSTDNIRVILDSRVNMKENKPVQRIMWDYEEEVKIPDKFKMYLWEYKDKAPLEILIIRILKYGDFEEIREIYNLYPEQVYKISNKYPDMKRGVRFWIRRWKNSSN